jgi:integrase
MASQGAAAAGTRNHLHSYLSRIFSLAEIPLGLRKPGSSPALSAYRAAKDPPKLFNFLYPPEVLALLGNEDIPLGRRVLYLLSTYFGWRKGTLLAFAWRGIDWRHQTVSVLHQKGHKRLDSADDGFHGTPIFFRVEPTCVLAVLRAWWEHCGRPEDDELVIRNVRGATYEGERKTGRPQQFEEVWRIEHDEADVLRRDLKASGVTRDILFSQSKNVQAIRFHDGRATFCTWARRDGRSDLWVTERTGHTPTTAMLARYTRMAQMLSDLDYQPFPCVLRAIPELASPGKKVECPACAPALSTSLSTTPQTGANGRNRPTGRPRKQADRDRSRRATSVEVLAP